MIDRGMSVVRWSLAGAWLEPRRPRQLQLRRPLALTGASLLNYGVHLAFPGVLLGVLWGLRSPRAGRCSRCCAPARVPGAPRGVRAAPRRVRGAAPAPAPAAGEAGSGHYGTLYITDQVS